MTREPMTQWTRDDERWIRRVQIALAVGGLRERTIERVLAEARAAVAVAGGRAEEALGSADAYAAARLEDSADDVERADRGRRAPSVRAWLSWVASTVGLMWLILAAYVLVAFPGVAGSVFAAGLVPLSLTLLVATASTTGAWALTQSGRLIGAAGAAVATIVAIVVGAIVITRVTDGVAPQIPSLSAWVLGGAGLVLFVLGLCLRGVRRALPAPPQVDAVWLRRFRGVLMGRYLFLPSEARAAAVDVADHVGLAGIAAEFGHPQVYARRLARTSANSTRRRATLLGAAWLAWAMFFVVVGVRLVVQDGLTVGTVLIGLANAFVTVVGVRTGVQELRRARRLAAP